MESVQMWIIGTAIAGIGIPALLRFLPKAKLIVMVQAPCHGAGLALSKLLALRLGKKAAESIEEGVFVTLASVVYAAVDAFMKGLLYDNDNRNTEGKK